MTYQLITLEINKSKSFSLEKDFTETAAILVEGSNAKLENFKCTIFQVSSTLQIVADNKRYTIPDYYMTFLVNKLIQHRKKTVQN